MSVPGEHVDRRPDRFSVVAVPRRRSRQVRARAYLALAAALPETFEVSAVLPHRELDEQERVSIGCPVVPDLQRLAATGPSFVLAAVSHDATPGLLRELVALGMPVLAETPPAPDVPALRALSRDVGAPGLVQVALSSTRGIR